MKNLRKLGAAVVLICVLALSALAGETQTPPCAVPEPGQIPTPPCAEQQASGNIDTPTSLPTAPGDMGNATVAGSETSFNEIATNVLLNCLSLF